MPRHVSEMFRNFPDRNKLPRRKQRGIKNFKFCHSALDAESSPVFWIPASAGMTNSQQAAGNITPSDSITPSPSPSPHWGEGGVRGRGEDMVFESQKVAIKYFVIAAIFSGLQVIVGLLLISKYIWLDPLIGFLPFNTGRAIHTNLLVVWMIFG